MTIPLVSIVVLSWNTKELLANCLRAIRRDPDTANWEVLVVDNASEDGSADMVEESFPWVRLIRNPTNLLYSEGNNIGARLANGDHLCLLNSDTEVVPGALRQLADYLAANDDCAAASPQLLWPDGRIQSGCRRMFGFRDVVANLPLIRNMRWARNLQHRAAMTEFDHASDCDVDQPPGACMMLRRSEYLESGGLDPSLSLYFNDVDLCRRFLLAGRRIRYIASARVYHHHGASTKKKTVEFGNPLWHRNRISYIRKWNGIMAAGVVMLCVAIEAAYMMGRVALGRRAWREKPTALLELCRHTARSLGLMQS